MEKPEALTISSPAAIRKRADELKNGKPLELPSTLVFKVARPSLKLLFRTGVIPSALVDAALKVGNNSLTARTQEELLNMYKVIDLTIIAAVKEPLLVEGEAATEDEYSVDDLAEEDKLFIFSFVNSGIEDLRPFRPKPESPQPGSDLPEIPGNETE